MANKLYTDDQVARLQSPQRNLIINGQMDFWQRGTGADALSGTPTYHNIDRFSTEITGTGSANCQASSNTPNSNYRNALRFNSSDTSAKNLIAWQRIEGDTLVPFIGKTLHLGAWMMSTAGSIDCNLYAVSNPSGSRDSWADAENLDKTIIKTGASVTLTNNVWQYVYITFTVTAECEDGLAVGFRFGTIDEVGQYYLTGCRLHQGDSKLPWSDLKRSHGDELALCQRYYETGQVSLSVHQNGTTDIARSVQMCVTKRTTPTVTFTNIQTIGNLNSTAANWVSNTTHFGLYHSVTGGTTGQLAFRDDWVADAEL